MNLRGQNYIDKLQLWSEKAQDAIRQWQVQSTMFK